MRRVVVRVYLLRGGLTHGVRLPAAGSTHDGVRDHFLDPVRPGRIPEPQDRELQRRDYPQPLLVGSFQPREVMRGELSADARAIQSNKIAVGRFRARRLQHA